MAHCPTAEGVLKYLDTLPEVVKERYIRRLQCLYGGTGPTINLK